MNDYVIDNIPLVYYIIAHDYSKYIGDEDIIQCGLLGLVEASKKYNPEKGKFASYARNYIHHEIINELKQRKKHNCVLSLNEFNERRDIF